MERNQLDKGITQLKKARRELSSVIIVLKLKGDEEKELKDIGQKLLIKIKERQKLIDLLDK